MSSYRRSKLKPKQRVYFSHKEFVVFSLMAITGKSLNSGMKPNTVDPIIGKMYLPYKHKNNTLHEIERTICNGY